MGKPTKASNKIDSPEYFEAMADYYQDFTTTCQQFELPKHVTMMMFMMVNHIRRAAGEIRTAKKGKK